MTLESNYVELYVNFEASPIHVDQPRLPPIKIYYCYIYQNRSLALDEKMKRKTRFDLS